MPSYLDEPGHNTFGNGPHKCVGRPLARVNPDHPPVTRMAGVNGIEGLHLLWDA